MVIGCRYCLFGLGDKSYADWNEMGRYVDQRLAELGAERIYKTGLGDANGK